MTGTHTPFDALLDATDIAVVPSADIDLAMQVMVDEGYALALYHGADATARRAIEAAFWRAFDGDFRRGNAALLRFWSLIDVMGARRLKAMFLDRGYAALAPITAAAASTRLNVFRGFPPQAIVSAMLVHDREVAAAAAERVAARSWKVAA